MKTLRFLLALLDASNCILKCGCRRGPCVSPHFPTGCMNVGVTAWGNFKKRAAGKKGGEQSTRGSLLSLVVCPLYLDEFQR